MDDEVLRMVLTSAPAAGLLLVSARYLWHVQVAVTARFDHLLQKMRADIVDLERHNERLEAQLSTERDARRADNHRCDEQLIELRSCIALLSPFFGDPPTT